MKINKSVGVLLLCLLAAACQREEAGAPAPAPQDAPSTQTPAKADAGLIDGYTPSFEYKIRSQRHTEEGAKYRHVVIVEFLGVDAAGVLESMRSDLGKQDFAVVEPVQHGDGTRLVATKKGIRLAADVYGPDKVKLNNAEARGIVYFGWLDQTPN